MAGVSDLTTQTTHTHTPALFLSLLPSLPLSLCLNTHTGISAFHAGLMYRDRK